MAIPLQEAESDTLKKDFLAAYKSNGGYSYAAAKQVGVRYSTAHYWMTNDDAFKQECQEVKELMLDRAELELYNRATTMKERDACLLFFLKTKGKERGYVERVETTGRDGRDLQSINIIEYKTNEADVDLKARIIAEHEASKLDKPAE